MSDVLIGQAYFLHFDPKLYAAMQPYPPLGALYAAAYLRERGYDVALFDAMLADSEARWDEALQENQPRFAVLYEDNFNYLSKMCLLRMREAAFMMIKMARQHGCTVIVAGADATDHYSLYLLQGADYVIRGEGEVTLHELMNSVTGRSGTHPEQIPGLVFNREDRFLDTGPRQILANLDEVPYPAWDLVDMQRYQSIWLERHGTFSINMVTTRGCPFHCNWCAKPIWGQRYHSRSPENVAAEVMLLQQEYGVEHIWFMDDIMGLKPGWIRLFADTLSDNGVQLSFKCLSRVDLLLRDGEVEALRDAGANIVWVGAESGSQKILDAMEKGIRVEQIYEAARRLHKAGIQIAFFLQFGYAGEDKEDIEKTLQMVRDCQPDDIGMSVTYPLPGTKFYERVKDGLGAAQNWQDSGDLAMLYQGPYSTDYYRQLHVVLHKEFRARKSWRRLSGRLPGRPSVRETAAMVYHTATLPNARRKMDRLAEVPHSGVNTLPGGMSREAAATPSPQPTNE